jgi:hypothetical protein
MIEIFLNIILNEKIFISDLYIMIEILLNIFLNEKFISEVYIMIKVLFWIFIFIDWKFKFRG